MSVATRPLAVLFNNPICNKYGSITSSIVVTSSPIVDEIASIPTGPPLYLLIIANNNSWSVLSNPILSTFNLFKASFVISILITPLPFTRAKSLTLLNNLLAIRGVPLLRVASS